MAEQENMKTAKKKEMWNEWKCKEENKGKKMERKK
jgi:hypothetical protein